MENAPGSAMSATTVMMMRAGQPSPGALVRLRFDCDARRCEAMAISGKEISRPALATTLAFDAQNDWVIIAPRLRAVIRCRVSGSRAREKLEWLSRDEEAELAEIALP